MASAATAVRDALVGNFLGKLGTAVDGLFFFFAKTGVEKKSPQTKKEEIPRVKKGHCALVLCEKATCVQPLRVVHNHDIRPTNPCGLSGRSQRRAMQLRSLNAALGPKL